MQRKTKWKEKEGGNIRRRKHQRKISKYKNEGIKVWPKKSLQKINTHLPYKMQDYVIIYGICLHLRLWNL